MANAIKWIAFILCLGACSREILADSRHIYVIGGQSNASGLLDGEPGGHTNVVRIETPDSRGFVGYAVGGTSIGYWLDSMNSAPLVMVLREYCKDKPLFVWFQGEKDANADDEPNYRRRLTEFIDLSVKAQCPAAKIVLIQIRSMHQIQEKIRLVQSTMGYPYIDSDQFELSQDFVHLTAKGLADLKETILSLDYDHPRTTK